MLFIVIYILWFIHNPHYRDVLLFWSSACRVPFLGMNLTFPAWSKFLSTYMHNRKWCHLLSEENSYLKYIYWFVVYASCTCIILNDCDINVLTLPSIFYVWGALVDNYVLWKLWVFVPVESLSLGSRGKAALMCCWYVAGTLFLEVSRTSKGPPKSLYLNSAHLMESVLMVVTKSSICFKKNLLKY